MVMKTKIRSKNREHAIVAKQRELNSVNVQSTLNKWNLIIYEFKKISSGRHHHNVNFLTISGGHDHYLNFLFYLLGAF